METYTVSRTNVYYRCANNKHLHPTKRGAEGCLRRHPTPPRTVTPFWTEEVFLAFAKRMNAGESMASIASSIGRSRERVRQAMSTLARKRCRRLNACYDRNWAALQIVSYAFSLPELDNEIKLALSYHDLSALLPK